MTTPIDPRKSEQAILNQSFDEDYNVLSVELVGFDSSNNVLRRVAVDSTGALQLDTTANDTRYVNITGDTMTGKLQGFIYADTKNTILSSTPAGNQIAFATDELTFYLYDGTSWRPLAIPVSKTASKLDMGAYGPVQKNNPYGYFDDRMTDKDIVNSTIGHNATTNNGAIRVNTDNDPDTFEIYLRSQWNLIIYDLTTSYGDFRHVPLTNEIYIWRGDSVANGLNGQPIIQEYQTSMGAEGAYRVLSGGVF